MDPRTDDLRINKSQPLVSPAVLAEELPLPEGSAQFVQQARQTIENILSGRDKRILAIVGPCSVHDPAALVDLDDSFHINKGLHLARQVLLDVAETGLPAASEFLDTTLGQFYAEMVSFGAIGARTVESQIHRELASGLSMPVGFKNATSGDIGVAIDAIRSAQHPHWFPSLTKEGAPAILHSTGNAQSYLILRGGSDTGPNYESAHIQTARAALEAEGLPASVIVDCSHGNSRKDPARQADVMQSLNAQIAAGESAIRGIMLESHLVAGSQKVVDGVAPTYGQSITDACLALEDTLPLLEQLAAVVRESW
jgi:3-deoxy-7-phosphoheptulonate synthase